jgi:hypothetical protein
VLLSNAELLKQASEHLFHGHHTFWRRNLAAMGQKCPLSKQLK